MAVISFPAAWHSGQSPMLSPAAACTFLQMGQTRYLLSPAASRNISLFLQSSLQQVDCRIFRGLPQTRHLWLAQTTPCGLLNPMAIGRGFLSPACVLLISSARMYLCDAFFGSEPHSKQYRCVLRFGTNSAPQMMHFLDFRCFSAIFSPFCQHNPYIKLEPLGCIDHVFCPFASAVPESNKGVCILRHLGVALVTSRLAKCSPVSGEIPDWYPPLLGVLFS